MTNYAVVSHGLKLARSQPDQSRRNKARAFESNEALPAAITRAASKQTYYTIRLFADRDRMLDAYRAYAYFRWLDDRLDGSELEQSERIVFLKRQQSLLDGQGERPRHLTDEERMLLDLIQRDREPTSGLQSYIQNMMAVMAFDANRRGRLVSQQELADYTQHLSVGVSEALHYFIGHNDPAPSGEARYLAVAAAHITHMLRDTFEDIAAGYFNIPREYLEAKGIQPSDLTSDAYREWVQERVRLARAYFRTGQAYAAQVKSLRCRLAGFAYIARFEWVLDTIEREGYRLRPEYPERKSLSAGLRMGRSVVSMLLEPVMRGLS